MSSKLAERYGAPLDGDIDETKRNRLHTAYGHLATAGPLYDQRVVLGETINNLEDNGGGALEPIIYKLKEIDEGLAALEGASGVSEKDIRSAERLAKLAQGVKADFVKVVLVLSKAAASELGVFLQRIQDLQPNTVSKETTE